MSALFGELPLQAACAAVAPSNEASGEMATSNNARRKPDRPNERVVFINLSPGRWMTLGRSADATVPGGRVTTPQKP